MLKNFKKNNNKGFTLVELLVVMAIMGILAVVAVPSLFKNIDKAKAAETVAYINAVKTEAVSQYANVQDGTVESATIDATSVTTAIDGGAPKGVAISSLAMTNGKCVMTVTVPESIETLVKGKITDKSITITKG